MKTPIDVSRLVEAANDDGEFQIAARYWDTRLEITVGADATELVIVNGRIVAAGEPGAFGSDLRRVRISAAEADWAKLLAPVPPPGWHNVGTARGFALEGNVLDRGPYYGAICRLVELMRDQINGPPASTQVAAEIHRAHDDAVGRYVYLDIQSTRYRVYYEETGSGIPLIMQHTAGTDGRQWRHILEHREFQRDFRLIAYDLPYHGKSLPPTSRRWWAEDYVLTKEFVLQAIVKLCEALALDRPVFMGCSIGGELAPTLAFSHPDLFRAVIGVNASLAFDFPPHTKAIDPTDSAPFIQVSSWFHPRIGNDWKASAMLGNTAPNSPEPYRRETAWLYSQGAPPIFSGDSIFYKYGHDLTEQQARAIDTSKIAVYLLTGEYDPLALDGGSEKLAACIDGAKFQLIPGAGHFAPSDNPEQFKAAIGPVLQEIAGKHR
jgi:pimeloyl-ACP methyl ester carboxylesterase